MVPVLRQVLFAKIHRAVVTACNDAGLLTNPVRPNAVRLMPPLTVSRSEIDQAIERLGTGIAQATRGAAA